MENNDKRPCPTGPGEYWYRRTPRGAVEPVYVGGYSVDGVLLDKYAWSSDAHNVEDDGRWLGPVPMPGEWAPRDLFEDLRYELGACPNPSSAARDVWLEARAWSNANPAPEDKP